MAGTIPSLPTYVETVHHLRSFVTTLVLVAAVWVLPVALLAEEPRQNDVRVTDVPGLLARVRDHQAALDVLKENFAYSQTVEHVEYDKNGKERSRTSRKSTVSFYRHREIDRLVAVDGKPLSGSDDAKEQARVEKLIRQLDEGKNPDDPDADRRMKLSVLLRAERFSNARRDSFRGRPVFVFDFAPDPSFRPANTSENFYHRIAGTMWVDETDLQIARVEFRLIGAFKVGGGAFFQMLPGATFAREQARYFGQIWLPTRAESRFEARAMLFYRFGVSETTTFSDYRRFDVSTEQKLLPAPAAGPPPTRQD